MGRNIVFKGRLVGRCHRSRAVEEEWFAQVKDLGGRLLGGWRGREESALTHRILA